MLLIFSFELAISEVIIQEIQQNKKKMAASSEHFLSEQDFEATLANFCCYDYDSNSSEAFEKIATD